MMTKKTLYLFPLLYLIGAPSAHSEVVFYSGFNNPDFCKRAEDEAPIDRFAEQAAQFLLQQRQAGTLPAPSSPLNIDRFFNHWLDAKKDSCSNSLSRHSNKIQQPPAADFDTVGYYTYVLTRLYPTEARQRQMWGILENTLADAPDLLQRIRDNWQQLNSPQQPK